MPAERVGIQVLLDTFETSLEGESSSYDVTLDYVSKPPPDYAPRQNRYTSSRYLPEPEGNTRNLVFSGNLVLTTGGGSTRGAFSGGLSVFRTKTSFSSLGFTTFWEGGHSVLFLENYELKAATEPTVRLGFNVGGELAVDLGPSVGLSIDGRYFHAASTNVDIQLTDILNLDEIIVREGLQDLQEQMSPGPVEIEPSFFRLSFGLKFRF